MTAAFLSMWISNLASTALMIPIVNAALDQLKEPKSKSYGTLGSNSSNHSGGSFVLSINLIYLSV
jgi:di/tricarboxylate transporter